MALRPPSKTSSTSALRDVADANGGVRALATSTGLNRESLYRMLSEAGNSSLDTLASVLTVFGLQLSIQGKHNAKRPRRQIAEFCNSSSQMWRDERV